MSLDPGSILWRATFFPSAFLSSIFFPFLLSFSLTSVLVWAQSLAEPTFFLSFIFFFPSFISLLYTYFFPSFFVLQFLPPLIPMPSFLCFFLLLYSYSFFSSIFFVYFFVFPFLLFSLFPPFITPRVHAQQGLSNLLGCHYIYIYYVIVIPRY